MCSGSCNSQFRGSLLFGRYQWDLDLWGRISPALTEEVELLKRVLGNAALWRAWSRGQPGVSGETRQGGRHWDSQPCPGMLPLATQKQSTHLCGYQFGAKLVLPISYVMHLGNFCDVSVSYIDRCPPLLCMFSFKKMESDSRKWNTLELHWASVFKTAWKSKTILQWSPSGTSKIPLGETKTELFSLTKKN